MKISPPSATTTSTVSTATTTTTKITAISTLRLDAAGYLSSSVASVVQPLDFSFTELLLSGVHALQLHYLRVTVDGHAFESPNFFKSRKAAEHAAVNVALMSFPFDGFQEASSLTESCHMPASVQGGSLSSPPMTHADCSAPSISDSSVGRPTGTRSYLLYNRIRVYPCVPDISFPKGITVLQISKIGGWL
ncbi:hypothetical protein EZV62_008566 [Acer yangbiense]|uniref:DRBM domain-containing protein n=1 Tax=Acer yangbiense TaxID=1000413 RepID=A0A5C7IDS4_9ROSI|nr:hypothetical protein EZV62_008566 [Acer yangbiense]